MEIKALTVNNHSTFLAICMSVMFSTWSLPIQFPSSLNHFGGMTTIAETQFIPLSTLNIVKMMFMYDYSKWLGKNIV